MSYGVFAWGYATDTRWQRLPVWVHCTSLCTFKGNADVRQSFSDVCVGRLPLGLDPGGAGNLPWAGSDGSLLASGGSITAWVLDAAAGTSGILSVHFLS